MTSDFVTAIEGHEVLGHVRRELGQLRTRSPAPDQHLRVMIGGGTLTQGGVALPWVSEGYYEVSLA